MNHPSPRFSSLSTGLLLLSLAACGGGGGAGNVVVPPIAVPPPLSVPTSSTTVALSGDDRLLVAVNQDHDSIAIFDASSDALPKVADVKVGGEPRSVAVRPQGDKAYVANATGGTVSVVDLGSRRVVKTIAVGTEPRAIVTSPNGSRVYVANSMSNSISVIDAQSDTVVTTVPVPAASGTQPRALAVTSDGDTDDLDEKVYVALFFAELRAGKTGLDEGQDDNREGRVVVLRTADDQITGTVALQPIADTDFKSNGSVLDFTGTANGQGGTNAANPANPAVNGFSTGAFPNQLQALALRPGSNFLYVCSTGASPNGPFAFNVNSQGLVSTIDSSNDVEVTGLASATVVRTAPLNLNAGLKRDQGNEAIFHTNPTGIAWKPDGSEAWIAVQTGDVIVRMTSDDSGLPTIDAPVQAGGSSIKRIDLQAVAPGQIAGKAPRGIVINRRGDRAYVQNFISRSISIVDLTTREIVGTSESSPQPLAGSRDATVQLGAELFHTGRGRMSSEAWGGCIVCHPDGLADSVTWMFDGGPRQTIPLDGMFNHANTSDQRILNWSAVRDENQDFELNTRGVFGGRGLIEDDRVLFILPGTAGAVPAERNQVLAYHQFLNTVTDTNPLNADQALPPVSDQRRDFGIATLDDGRVYYLGGRSGQGQGSLVPSVIEFDPRTGISRVRSQTGFTARHSLGAFAVTTARGPRIYAIGGFTATAANTAPSNLVQEYDPATDAWRTVAPLPLATAEFGIASTGLLNKGEPVQLIHVLGGNRGSEQTPNVTGVIHKFDPDPSGAGVWSTLSFTITARRNLGAAAVIRGAFPFHVFAIGGRDQNGTVLGTVESYVATTTQTQQTDPVALIATPITQLPAALRSFGIGTSNNRIYLAGGVNGAGDDQGAILEYNPAANPQNGPGAPGTPSGVWAVKAQLPFAVRSLQLSSPRPVTNFLPVKNAARDVRQDSIAEWIKAAVRAPIAPSRGSNDPAIGAGRLLFAAQNAGGIPGLSCASCHGGEKWSRSSVDFAGSPSPDLLRGSEEVIGAELRRTATQPGTATGSANAVLTDVGTFFAARNNEVRPNPTDIGQRIAALGANGFQAPSLLGVASSAPYFHSGSARTLEDVLNGTLDGNGSSLLRTVHRVGAGRADLIKFLESIDAATPIFP